MILRNEIIQGLKRSGSFNEQLPALDPLRKSSYHGKVEPDLNAWENAWIFDKQVLLWIINVLLML